MDATDMTQTGRFYYLMFSIVKGLLQLYFSLFYAIDLKTVSLSKKSVFKSKKPPVFQGLLIV